MIIKRLSSQPSWCNPMDPSIVLLSFWRLGAISSIFDAKISMFQCLSVEWSIASRRYTLKYITLSKGLCCSPARPASSLPSLTDKIEGFESIVHLGWSTQLGSTWSHVLVAFIEIPFYNSSYIHPFWYQVFPKLVEHYNDREDIGSLEYSKIES